MLLCSSSHFYFHAISWGCSQGGYSSGRRTGTSVKESWKLETACASATESSELESLHKDNEEWSEKAFATLIKWKQNNASKATYRRLYDALCHDLVDRTDLAEDFCCSCSKPEG